MEQARECVRAAIPRAAAVLTKLLHSEDDRIRLRAAEAILNRSGITEAGAAAVNNAEEYVGGGTTPPEPDPAEEAQENEPVELACPKCGESIQPTGQPEGTCPHCNARVRVELVGKEEEPTPDPIKLPCPKCRKKIALAGCADGTCPHCETPIRAEMMAVESAPAPAAAGTN